MRVLLFAMPDSSWGFDAVCKIPNLGIASIAGNLDEDVEVATVDLVLKKKNFRRYVHKFVTSFRPELVGLSCMTFQYTTAAKLAKQIKEADSSIKIAIGGYHPTLTYHEIAASDAAQYLDFIVRGEGEATFRELVRELEGKHDFKKIAGLSYKSVKGKFVHNKPRELLPPEQIKLPNRKDRLLKTHNMFLLPADSIETSRGCVFSCNFCSILHMYGKMYREFTPERVTEDIAVAKEGGAKILMVTDDNLTLYPKRLIKLCDAIIKAGHNDIQYYTQAGVDGIAYSPEVARKMARAGFDGVFLGIENVSKRNLKFYDKGRILKKIRKAVKYLHDNDMIIAGGFVLGTPDDREIDFWENYEFSKELEVDYPVFQILTPYPKTKIREDLAEMGLITNYEDIRRYNGTLANVRTKHLSESEVRVLQQMMYNKYYHDQNYLKVTKKHHPLFYWTTALTWVPRMAKQKFLKTIGFWDDRDLALDDIKKDEASIID